jgi:hypothetical protein
MKKISKAHRRSMKSKVGHRGVSISTINPPTTAAPSFGLNVIIQGEGFNE